VVVVDPPSVYDQNERIGGSLTPEDVSQIYREADTGYMWRLVDLADESRQKDCHLQSILFTRESSVAGLDWQITPASNTAKDKKIAAWCDEWMRGFGADDPGAEPRDLPNLISHLQGAVYYGYAAAEILWAKRDGKIVPVGADPVHARRFVYEPDHGRLHFWDVNGQLPYPGVGLLQKWPDKFIQYQPRINGGVATREGLMRVLLWAALFRNWALSDWLKLAEIAWKPWRIGKYQKGKLDKEDRKILLKALRELSSSGVAMLPDSVELAIEWAKSSGGGSSSGGDHATLCAFFAAEMTKAVLGATLGVEQGRVGTQALGNVHERRMYSAFEWDALNIASVLRRQMIAAAVRRNFGASARIPGFSFLTEDAADFEATARGFLYLRQAGLRIAAKDPRDRLGLSEPLDGDELMTEAGTEPRLPPGIQRKDEPAQTNESGDSAEDDDAEDGAA
jgi:phage gp29-like protein